MQCHLTNPRAAAHSAAGRGVAVNACRRQRRLVCRATAAAPVGPCCQLPATTAAFTAFTPATLVPLQISATPASSAPDQVRIAVLGASGYTGEEVVRLLALHPSFKVTALTGDRQAGKQFSEVFPHLVTATNVPALCKIDEVDWSGVDGVFCCLPHATTQEVLKALPEHVKVVDLSADFRLRDVNSYAEW